MRVLWCSEQPTRPTGYGVVSREFVKRLVERGHEVYVMGWDYHGEDFKHEEGWTLVHAGSRFGGDPLVGAATTMDYNLNRLKPDVVFSLADVWHTEAIVRSCNRFKVPHVSYLPIDGKDIPRAWTDILKMTHTPLWMSLHGRDEFNAYVQRFHSLGTAVESLRDPFLDRYAPRQNFTEATHMRFTEVLYHGVDLDLFKPVSQAQKEEWREALGLSRWKTVFLSVGRNGNRKQQPRLLEAFKEMLSKVENPDEVGLIMHTGDPTNMMGLGGWNLPEMVREMGLENNITFSDPSAHPLLGMKREDMAKLFAMSDCHVLATGGEGFGIPSIEAMACGVPIILPDNTTGPEFIGKGAKTMRGKLVKNDAEIVGPNGVKMSLVSIKALANALQWMVEHPAKRQAMGKRARKWAEERVGWDDLTDQLERLLEKASKTPHPQGNNTMVKA